MKLQVLNGHQCLRVVAIPVGYITITDCTYINTERSYEPVTNYLTRNNAMLTYIYMKYDSTGAQLNNTIAYAAFSLLVACPNTPTLPNRAHPLDFHENKLIVQKYCYYLLDRCENITWRKKIERFHRQISSVFQFKSGRV